MTLRRVVPCLVLVGTIVLYVWPFVTGTVNHDDLILRAKDALQAARVSVHEAAQSYEESSLEGHADAKFGRLQLSLDSLHQRSSPTSRSVNRPHLEGMHQIDMCGTLAGKRITMIGGEHIYRLHVLLLQHRERAEGKLFPCQYHEFCTHHHICLPHRDDAPQPRYIKPPTPRELIDTESAVVSYIVSDTLYSAQSESSWKYTLPFVDPTTGIRLRETYWLAAARRANIVILGRGPLNAPGQTYARNWSFLHHIPKYVDKSPADIAGGHGNFYDVHVPRSLEILNAAVHLTVSRFLPDLFQLLRAIRREVRPSRRKRWVWPSSWYHLPGRGVAKTVLLRSHVRSKVQDMIQCAFSQCPQPRFSTDHLLTLQLSALLTADVMNTTLLEDPWTLFFNAQVYLQNMMLRELLPRHGIVFLPLDVPWFEDGHARGCRHTHSSSIDVNIGCVGETFLTGMDYVLRYLE